MYSLIAFNFLFTVFKIDFHFIPESILIHIKLLYFSPCFAAESYKALL